MYGLYVRPYPLADGSDELFDPEEESGEPEEDEALSVDAGEADGTSTLSATGGGFWLGAVVGEIEGGAAGASV